jgi:DNA ligase 4
MSFQQTFALRTPFLVLAQLLEKLTAERGKKKEEILNKFFQRYGWGDFYPVYRLLMPQFDKDRRTYNMKEKVLAKLYVEALSVDASSETAKRLLNYKTPTANQPNAGDFGTAVYLALEERMGKASNVTIAELNTYLDSLSQAPDKQARINVIKLMLHDSTAVMHKWIVRIILKDLKVGKGKFKKGFWFLIFEKDGDWRKAVLGVFAS